MIVSATISNSREAEIAGAILSVVDHVDRVLIVDTGIRDGTLKRARKIAGRKLSVVKRRWVDFSTARNASLRAARTLGAEWIVIVDTDERIDLKSVDLRAVLANTNVDVLRMEADDGHYPKERILRAAAKLRFVGPTHEALIGVEACETLRGATFYELPKYEEQIARKCARDVRLLSAHIKKNRDEPRWWYYLGVSYEGLGDRKRAADAYGRCVKLRGTGYEAAWASYKQAEQLFHLELFEEAIAAAVRGIGADASFAECACVAATAALRLEMPARATAWASIAESVGYYKGCGVERPYFRHLPALYELPYAVLRLSLPTKESRARAERDFHAAELIRVQTTAKSAHQGPDWLSVSRAVPDSVRQEARAMLRPPKLGELCRSARAVKIRFTPPGGRLPTNPSVCNHRGALWCVVRAVNYSMHGRKYTVHDPLGVVRTENYLGRLRPNGEFLRPVLMRDLDTARRWPSSVVGYEDVRLVSIKGRNGDAVLTGSATICDRSREGLRRIARLRLDRQGNVRRADVQPSNQLAEKNWMPISVKGKLAWIYSLDPTAILPGPLRSCPLALDHIRGGAAIRLEPGYLCVVHESIETEAGRIYLHRFARLDGRFNVTGVSGTWVFEHHGIEFCAGIARIKDELVLSYGVADCEAWIVRVKTKEIENMKWITP
jgi:tetratricopeptide (TPR) repeat protein